MEDFISQTKLPGVLVAKAMISKYNFDSYLSKEDEIRRSFESIGYAVKLSKGTKEMLVRNLDTNLRKIESIAKSTLKKEIVLSDILTLLLKKQSKRQKKNSLVIYHLSQILFLWDEFVDFSDYEKNKGDISKIRESSFYRGATEKLVNISDTELNKLKTRKISTASFERALYRLQRHNRKNLFSHHNYQIIISALEQLKLSSAEIIYLLLSIEASIFIHTAVFLSKLLNEKDSKLFENLKDYKEGIRLTKKLFNLNDNKLEQIIEKRAQKIVLLLKPDDITQI